MAKLTYTNVNGYLIPNLTCKSDERMGALGKYGLLRRNYLKKHKNSLYQVMLLQGTIRKVKFLIPVLLFWESKNWN